MCAGKIEKMMVAGCLAIALISGAGKLWAGTLVNDLADAQLNKQLREAQEADKPKSAPAHVQVMPNLPRADTEKKLILVAVYGLGDSLMADIECQGAVFSVKPQDLVDGWRVLQIWPSRLVMEKKKQKRELTLAVRPTDVYPGGAGIPSGLPGGAVPPPPLPSVYSGN